jgi:putative membrane protein
MATPKGLSSEAAHARIREAVAEVERQTSGEVVVAVHPASAEHRQTEWLGGVLLAGLWLLVFLYHPASFDFTWLPLELLAAGLVGVGVTRGVWSVKRGLTSRRALRREVDRASKAAFVDLGISRTSGRTGLLVFVSLLEREARILRDVGVPKLDLFGPLTDRLAQATRAGDVEAFTRTLAELGPALAERLPRAHDDANELADEPQEAAS